MLRYSERVTVLRYPPLKVEGFRRRWCFCCVCHQYLHELASLFAETHSSANRPFVMSQKAQLKWSRLVEVREAPLVSVMKNNMTPLNVRKCPCLSFWCPWLENRKETKENFRMSRIISDLHILGDGCLHILWSVNLKKQTGLHLFTP